MPRLGVLGWPVRHSRSPAMHNAALAALGMEDWRYQLLPVPPERLVETVRALPVLGFVGANVTIPHKEAVLEVATLATAQALAIGAANTLTFRLDGDIEADNTDAPGLIDAMHPHDPRGKRCLVLGAGGSARAAVYALVQFGAAEVAVWNRTAARAEILCRDLGSRPITWDEAVTWTPHVIVNCTSIGLHTPGRELKELPLPADAFRAGVLVADLAYRPGGTALTQAARAGGADVVDGLDMLAAQGAASLTRWTGRVAPRDLMRRAADQ